MMKASQICKSVITMMVIIHVSSRTHGQMRHEVNYNKTHISGAAIDSEIPNLLNDDKTPKRRLIRAAPSIVRPEVLVVVDGSLYKRIGKNASTAKKYIINFLTKIDQKFETLSNPIVELNMAVKVSHI